MDDEKCVRECFICRYSIGQKDYVYITMPYLIVDGSMVSAPLSGCKKRCGMSGLLRRRSGDKALIHMTTRSYYIGS